MAIIMEEWYRRKAGDPKTVAGEIFQAAAERFSSELTFDNGKIVIARNASCLEDLHGLVTEAKDKYEDCRRNKKTRRWLGEFATRLQFYGSIMDVLVQHHPEYTALAWGAMKFVFVTFLNHQNSITALAKALSLIADSLPRVELSIMLYPTERMKGAVVELSAYLIKFLIRAHDWYREGFFKHVLHSVTRPAELRLKDSMNTIATCSRKIDQLASSGSQAEQRDIHKKMDSVVSKVEQQNTQVVDLSNKLTSLQSAFSNIHITQGTTFLSHLHLNNIADTFRYYAITRNHYTHKLQGEIADQFWRTPKLISYRSEGRDLSIREERFMVDYSVYLESHADSIGSQASLVRKGKDPESRSMTQASHQPTPELPLLSSSIKGFDFRLNEWVDLEIDRIVEVKWNNNAIERLTNDTILERMHHILTESVSILWEADGIEEKSLKDIAIALRDEFERIFTIAAETIAETDEKPLYRVSCKAIGTGIEAVEKNLRSAFHRAKVWNCILLVQDLDYFFGVRILGGYGKNPPNSALLRKLRNESRRLYKMDERYVQGWALLLEQLQGQRQSCVSFASDPEIYMFISDNIFRRLVTEKTIRSCDFSTGDATAIVP